ncbi:hypothetical protein [Flavobacterium aurantiibacter]|uniref:Uncharacterized protein n=1 Tax=Flavobacterium aurantiibacter TaxID=2023067 RepID=A0A256ABK7_9FLAO|nr:hypothetical protein [Flavobacterium aurantiibacter]OYQ51048.1 hypothetical protein CHX27_00465 [Flavobacterium aurantiibacter]
MASQFETGHAKNLANFQELTAFVVGFGTAYNPTKNALKVPQLNALIADAQSKLTDVVAKNTSYNNAVNERVLEFSSIRELATRLVNAIQATDATAEKIKDAKGYNRKLQGKRATPSAAAPTSADAPAPNKISASQQSFEQRIQHFAGLVSVLQSEPSYAPNENDLKIATLTAKQASLQAKNTAVATAFANVSSSRIARNNTLYNETNGLVATALEVKKYIKSVFGASSPEFAQVKGIEFKKVKS